MLVQAVAHLRVGGGICRDILQHSMAGWDIVSILWTIFQAGRQVYIRSLLAPRRGKNLSCRFSMCGAESLSRRTPGIKPPDSTQLVILLGVKMLRTRIRAQNHRISDRSTRKGPSCWLFWSHL